MFRVIRNMATANYRTRIFSDKQDEHGLMLLLFSTIVILLQTVKTVLAVFRIHITHG